MSMNNKAACIKGVTVELYTKEQTGKDALNRPTYEEKIICVDNVLIGQPTEQEITETLNLTGRRAAYILALPKGDYHDWTDKKVVIFGEEYKTIGAPVQGIEGMIPLEWNKKVRCERING